MQTLNKKFIFLTVGRLVKVKNIGLQIEAMKEVVRATRNAQPVIELWIAGDGPERKNLALLVTRYSLQNHVRFFGWRNDLNDFYGQADVFLFTSNYEGWGMAAIEAAGHGLPVIMTDVGCAGEVIKNRESGIVIPVGDSKRLADAMLEMIESENLRQKLGEAGKKATEKIPNKEETSKLYKESWEKCLIKKAYK